MLRTDRLYQVCFNGVQFTEKILKRKVFEPFVPSAESADTEPVLYMEYGKGKAFA